MSREEYMLVDETSVTGEDEIDLRKYWSIIRRNLWRVVALAVVVGLLATLSVYSMQPVYRAKATLLIESQKAKVVTIEEVYGIDPANSEYYATQFEILKSRGIAAKVINKLELANYPEFNQTQQSWFDLRKLLPEAALGEKGKASEESLRQSLISTFLSRLNISPVRKTQLVNISFEASDPVLARDIANALCNAYIENDLEARMSMTRQAAHWLTGSLKDLKEKSDDATKRLQAYRERVHLVDVKGVLTLTAQELNETTKRLGEARARRSELETISRQVQELAGKPVEMLESIPAIQKQPMVHDVKAKMAEARHKVTALSKRYGSKHPTMIEANSRLETLQANLNRELERAAAGLRKDYDSARTNEATLQRELAKGEQKVQSISRKQTRLLELEREVETNRKLNDTFFTRFQETNITGDLQQVNARIVDPAIIPTSPSKPNKKLIIMLAFVLSLMLGIALAFLAEALDNTIRSIDGIEEKLGEATLGLLPLIKDKGKGKDKKNILQLFSQDPNSSFSESIRTIRTGVVLSGLDNPHKTLLVTSSLPSEGKTTVAANLAIAMGQMENVLLIDADMRRPSVAKSFGLPIDSPGLSNLVAGSNDLAECIHTFKSDKIDVLPAGLIPPNPQELLSSQRFKSLLESLEGKYDRIIVDSAPVQAVSDALILSTLAKAVIFVVKADATNSHIVKASFSRLHKINAPIAGVVLNQVDIDKSGKYYGNYYHGYYDPYGYSGTETDKTKA